MTTQTAARSATILRFPEGGRAARTAPPGEAAAAPAAPAGAYQLAIGDAWYHAEAIRDAMEDGGR